MDDIARLREHLIRRDTQVSTHWDGCIESHPICALAWALDEVEYLRRRADDLERENEFLRRQEANRG